MWVSLRFPSGFGWFLKGEHGVLSTLSAESARQMFVLLGMVNYLGWFEGCFISQRAQCRIMAASVLTQNRVLRTRGNVDLEGWVRSLLGNSFFTVLRESL